MAAKRSNPLSGYISVLSGCLTLGGLIIGVIVYVVGLTNTISDNQEDLAEMKARLDAATEVLELNPYTQEPVLSERINHLEFYLWEESQFEEKILLLEIALSDLQESYDSTLFYLYSMDSHSGGVQQSIQSIKTHLSVIENQIAGIMSDHNWYAQYLSSLENTLREDLGVSLSIVMPKDSYDYGGSYGR